MKNKSIKHKTGNLLIVMGMLLLISAVSLVIYNKIEDMKAGKASEEVLSKFTSTRLVAAPVASLYDQMNMMVEKIDGEEYIGILSIPAYDLLLPVNAKADLTRLQFSPCYFFGNYKEDNMVICAHNFFRHFGYLLQIPPGEEVIFISADGYVYKYQVAYSETVMPTEIERMVGTNTDNRDWDLTLFTCNWGGASRCAVRCKRVKYE